jgi:hypothetical protein
MNLRRSLQSFAGVAISLACLVSIAYAQQTANPSSPELIGKQAVDLVLSRFQIDSNNVVEKTGKPLSPNGKWAVAKETPASCPKTMNPCVRVLYSVPEADVICEWTVLLMSSDKNNFVIDLNENAARYLIGKPHTSTSNVPKLSGNNPSFPHDARDSRIQGNVKLIAEIDTTGHVGEIKEISGPEALRGVSTAAVKTWTYKPLIVESNAVPLRSLITINFAIGH